MPCRFASSGTVATSRSASRAILALNAASNFLRDLVISVLHPLRQSRTLHTLTFGPISGVHFRPLTRRTIVIGVLAMSGLSKAASAQVWRVALVTSGRGIPILDIIRTSLNGAGYEEGKNLIIDFREANGRYGRAKRE